MVLSVAAALIAARLTAVHVPLRVIPLVSRGRGAEGIKREHGADYPSGANAVAAPATVSGQSPSLPTDLSDREGDGDDKEAVSQETCQRTWSLVRKSGYHFSGSTERPQQAG
jgi:hypothetical protein